MEEEKRASHLILSGQPKIRISGHFRTFTTFGLSEYYQTTQNMQLKSSALCIVGWTQERGSIAEFQPSLLYHTGQLESHEPAERTSKWQKTPCFHQSLCNSRIFQEKFVLFFDKKKTHGYQEFQKIRESWTFSKNWSMRPQNADEF